MAWIMSIQLTSNLITVPRNDNSPKELLIVADGVTIIEYEYLQKIESLPLFLATLMGVSKELEEVFGLNIEIRARDDHVSLFFWRIYDYLPDESRLEEFENILSSVYRLLFEALDPFLDDIADMEGEHY